MMSRTFANFSFGVGNFEKVNIVPDLRMDFIQIIFVDIGKIKR